MQVISNVRDRITRKVRWVRNEIEDPPRLPADFVDVDYDNLRANMSASQLKEREERIAVAHERYSDQEWTLGDIDPDAGFAVEEKIETQEYSDCLQLLDEVVADPSQHVFLPTTEPKSIPFSPFEEKHSPIFRYAMSNELVGRASRYLGQIPVLTACWLWYMPKGQKAHGGSQFYHLDAEDESIVKVFTPVTDQSIYSGPLSVVRRDTSQKICQKIVDGSPYKGVHYFRASRFDDRAIEDNCPAGEPIQLIPKRGNVAFADAPGCFHYGSRPVPRSKIEVRWVLMIRYVKCDSRRLLVDDQYQNIIRDVPEWLESSKIGQTDRIQQLLLQDYCREPNEAP
jgi:hypothetical protein